MTLTDLPVIAGRPDASPAGKTLPDGWEITEFTGQGGRPVYAVYANGKRLASGMPSIVSAERWAHLLLNSHLGTRV